MGVPDAEKWIVDLIRSAQIDARLDAKSNSIMMMQPDTSLYQQINEQTRDLIGRTRGIVDAINAAGAGVGSGPCEGEREGGCGGLAGKEGSRAQHRPALRSRPPPRLRLPRR